MKLTDFDYHLPQNLIAQTPIEPRSNSRLLILEKNVWNIEEKQFFNIEDYLWENDVLVLNKTRVINARLNWTIREKDTVCEIFLHKQISQDTWDCLVYPGKKLKIWAKIDFYDVNLNFWFSEWKLSESQSKIGWVFEWAKLNNLNPVLSAEIVDISDSGRIVKFNKSWIEFLDIVDKVGQIPLPPYIKECLENSSRYQTVFSEINWSVAAPTAGLHFTEELLEKLEKKWVKIEKVLLHVWLGTFKWVETENILEHKMHSEFAEIEEETAIRLNKYKKEWKRIIAVGTTSVRTLESFWNSDNTLSFGSKDTDIFIYPWYTWKFVDSIITNFHLPKSTLLMLISSFAWKEKVDEAYKYAVENEFRFFSFWDAMWIK